MDPTPELQLKERRWLPVLAPRLPLPVPTPVRSGEPSERFPKHWTVMTWVPGEPLDHGSISRGAHATDTLAGFLRALHVEAPAEAQASSDFGAHPKRCTCGFEQFLQAIDPDAVGDVRAVWADAVAAPEWEGPSVWVHGDLHPANVVVSDGTLSGIVDFGALFAGDPAWDLGAAWVLLPAGTASRFFDAHADAATIRRARGLAAMKSNEREVHDLRPLAQMTGSTHSGGYLDGAGDGRLLLQPGFQPRQHELRHGPGQGRAGWSGIPGSCCSSGQPPDREHGRPGEQGDAVRQERTPDAATDVAGTVAIGGHPSIVRPSP
ncbi:phosphotransferase [Nonomuraea muscovyensis]|uniref:phosphotransferase n=1 Tax=Nonomuraea muscovyensis TaxID=1124761 RepID=UPI0033D5105E